MQILYANYLIIIICILVNKVQMTIHFHFNFFLVELMLVKYVRLTAMVNEGQQQGQLPTHIEACWQGIHGQM